MSPTTLDKNDLISRLLLHMEIALCHEVKMKAHLPYLYAVL